MGIGYDNGDPAIDDAVDEYLGIKDAATTVKAEQAASLPATPGVTVEAHSLAEVNVVKAIVPGADAAGQDPIHHLRFRPRVIVREEPRHLESSADLLRLDAVIETLEKVAPLPDRRAGLSAWLTERRLRKSSKEVREVNVGPVQRVMFPHGQPMVVVFASLKGGVGKTSHALQEAVVAADAGRGPDGAGDGVDVVLFEASLTSDVGVWLGISKGPDQARLLEYWRSNGDPQVMLENCLQTDQATGLRILTAPLEDHLTPTVEQLAQIRQMLLGSANMIFVDTDGASPSERGERGDKIRMLLPQAHAIMVPVFFDPQSVLDGARFFREAMRLGIPRERLWLVITGEQGRSPIPVSLFDQIAPERHLWIPSAREFVREGLRTGDIPVLANKPLRAGYREMLRRLLIAYRQQVGTAAVQSGRRASGHLEADGT